MGNVFNRYGAGGGKSEGIYIWKKYEYKPAVSIVNPTFTLEYSDGKIFPIVDANFDWLQLPSVYNSSAIRPSDSTDSKTVIDFLDGFTNTSNGKFFPNTESYSGSIMVYRDSSNWKFLSGVNYTNPPSFELATALTGWATNQKTFSYTGTKTIPAKIGDMVGFVVSDKENAYPHKEVMGDYYYERIIFDEAILGGSKIETGSFYLSSATNIYTVNHNLGVIPKFAYAWKSAQVNGAKRLANVYTGSGTQAIVESYVQDGNATVSTGGTSKATETTAVFNTYSTNTAHTMTGTWQYILIA